MEQVFKLSFPVFLEVIKKLDEIQLDRTKSEVFPGVTAALNGSETAMAIFKNSGKIVKAKSLEISKEDLRRATEKAIEVAKKYGEKKHVRPRDDRGEDNA